MVCHADDGSGAMPGVIDLGENRVWLTIDSQLLLKRLKQGIQNTGGGISMPAKGGNPKLTDNDLQKIILYMQKYF
jgi:cytochrome c5